MNSLNRYLKIARNILVESQKDDINSKIIKRISSVNESDEELLDENFKDYFKKSNSRIYLFLENIKNNPGKAILLIFGGIFFIGIILFILKSPLSENEK